MPLHTTAMRRSPSRFLAIATILAAAPVLIAQTSTPRAMTIDDVMSLKQARATAISPDGRQVVYTVTAWEHPNANPAKGDTAKGDRHEQRTHLWLVPASGGAARQLTFGDRGESAPAWSRDGRQLAFLAARGTGEDVRQQVWVLPIDGGEAWKLTDARDGVTGFAWSRDGSKVAYLVADTLPRDEDAKRRRRDDPRVYESSFRLSHIWVIDVASRQATEVAHGEFAVRGTPSWSPDGTRLAFGASPTPMLRDLRGDVYILTLATRQLEKISAAPHSPATELARPVWSPDGRTLAFVIMPQSDRVRGDGIMESVLGNGRLILYDVATRRSHEVHDPKFDFQLPAVQWTRDSKRLRFVTADRAYQGVFEYNVAARTFTKVAGSLLVRGMSFSDDDARAAFVLETATSPGDVYISDARFASPRKLTDLNPQVRGLTLGETEVVTWKSTDGTPVEGVLLKPVGYRAGQRYPLLVEAHGGPTGVSTAGFKGPGQLWAAREWAVLYPNPRGSTGYGEKFMVGNLMDWGGGDYRDIMSGVDELIRRGIADSSKLALAGWSYGGYMAAWAVTQTSRFKAARMGAGVSDVLSMYGTSDIPGYIGMFFSGAPSPKTLDYYRAHSPITFADRVTTPVLILHGADDQRVPSGQALAFYRALRDAGKTVELVLYPRAGHEISEYYHQIDRMRRDHDWISRYTLGAPVP
jgi:dipeptidyl aminopeptidase/acylaminoacyl peptidase